MCYHFYSQRLFQERISVISREYFCFDIDEILQVNVVKALRLVRQAREDGIYPWEKKKKKKGLGWASFKNTNGLWLGYTLLEMMWCHSAWSVEDAVKNNNSEDFHLFIKITFKTVTWNSVILLKNKHQLPPLKTWDDTAHWVFWSKRFHRLQKA